MRARRLLERQEFLGPERLVAVTQAFEKAWAVIQSRYADRDDREAARFRLANIVLDLAQEGIAAEHLSGMAAEIAKRPLN